MKKRFGLLVLLLIVLSSFAFAEEIPEEESGIAPDSPLYFVDTLLDDFALKSKKGNERAELALRIKNERIAEAAKMVRNRRSEHAVRALQNAEKVSLIVEENKFSPAFAEKAEAEVKRGLDTLEAMKTQTGEDDFGLRKAIGAQQAREEMISAAKDFIRSIGKYCGRIAEEDPELLKTDKTCNSKEAPPWLKEYIDGDLKLKSEQAKGQVVDKVTTCVMNPRECDCTSILVEKYQNECELVRDLAVKCQYEEDIESCNKLGNRKLGNGNMKDEISLKEKEYFEKNRPKECADAKTPRECYEIQKNLYSERTNCDGITKEECTQKMAKVNLPPACLEAGLQTTGDCAKLMFSKFGKPKWCAELSDEECILRGMGRMHNQEEFPQECKDLGLTSPQDCFKVISDRKGLPEECKNLSAEECYKRKRETKFEGVDCKGITSEQCYVKHVEAGKLPQECVGKTYQECKNARVSKGPQNDCEGRSAEQCYDNIKEKYGVPEQCRELGKEECEKLMRSRGQVGRPGAMPNDCEGLRPEQCYEKYIESGKVPECQGLSMEQCKQSMKERQEKLQSEHSNTQRPVDCNDLTDDECRKLLLEKRQDVRVPDQCEGLSRERCAELIKSRNNQNQRLPENWPGEFNCPGPDDYCQKALGEKYRRDIVCINGMCKEKPKQGPGKKIPERPITRPVECEKMTDEQCKEFMLITRPTIPQDPAQNPQPISYPYDPVNPERKEPYEGTYPNPEPYKQQPATEQPPQEYTTQPYPEPSTYPADQYPAQPTAEPSSYPSEPPKEGAMTTIVGQVVRLFEYR